MLRSDLDAPRKQRHTATRILARLVDEHDAAELSYSTVRDYVRVRRAQIGRPGAARGPGPDVLAWRAALLGRVPVISAQTEGEVRFVPAPAPDSPARVCAVTSIDMIPAEKRGEPLSSALSIPGPAIRHGHEPFGSILTRGPGPSPEREA